MKLILMIFIKISGMIKINLIIVIIAKILQILMHPIKRLLVRQKMKLAVFQSLNS